MIVSFINLKGGCGKTTSCIATSVAAERAGKCVSVYDADPQSSATDWAFAADDEGAPLPFVVDCANKATVKNRVAKLRGAGDKWAFIDCPPSGDIVDVVKDVSDFVVVPTTPAPADMAKATATAETLAAGGFPYAILLTRTAANTLNLKNALQELSERDLSYFETQVPDREAVRRLFGKGFGQELYGYDAVFAEIEEGLEQ